MSREGIGLGCFWNIWRRKQLREIGGPLAGELCAAAFLSLLDLTELELKVIRRFCMDSPSPVREKPVATIYGAIKL